MANQGTDFDHDNGEVGDEAFHVMDTPPRTGRNSGEKHLAILRRGNVWYHKTICFNKGVRVVIDDAMYLWMEEHAVDFVASEDKEVTGKAKFEYRLHYEGNEPVGTALDPFEDVDDDRLRRREAYREPYRPPVKARPRHVRRNVEEELIETHPVRTRHRVR